MESPYQMASYTPSYPTKMAKGKKESTVAVVKGTKAK
jgi:hypothetical protein